MRRRADHSGTGSGVSEDGAMEYPSGPAQWMKRDGATHAGDLAAPHSSAHDDVSAAHGSRRGAVGRLHPAARARRLGDRRDHRAAIAVGAAGLGTPGKTAGRRSRRGDRRRTPLVARGADARASPVPRHTARDGQREHARSRAGALDVGPQGAPGDERRSLRGTLSPGRRRAGRGRRRTRRRTASHRRLLRAAALRPHRRVAPGAPTAHPARRRPPRSVGTHRDSAREIASSPTVSSVDRRDRRSSVRR